MRRFLQLGGEAGISGGPRMMRVSGSRFNRLAKIPLAKTWQAMLNFILQNRFAGHPAHFT
jgi:hypothetical protein